MKKPLFFLISLFFITACGSPKTAPSDTQNQKQDQLQDAPSATPSERPSQQEEPSQSSPVAAPSPTPQTTPSATATPIAELPKIEPQLPQTPQPTSALNPIQQNDQSSTGPNPKEDLKGRFVKIDIRYSSGGKICSGVILTNEFILTADHCFKSDEKVDHVRVFTEYKEFKYEGDVWRKNNGDLIDLGLLKPSKSLSLVDSLWIPSSSEKLKLTLDRARAEGRCVNTWGRQSGARCQRVVSYNLKRNFVVVQGTVIPGDSGGPAWIDGFLIGVIKGYRTSDNVTILSVFDMNLISQWSKDTQGFNTTSLH